MITLTLKSKTGQPEVYYCVQDAADKAGISRQWLHTLINQGKVKADIKRSGRRWVAESEIKRIAVKGADGELRAQ